MKEYFEKRIKGVDETLAQLKETIDDLIGKMDIVTRRVTAETAKRQTLQESLSEFNRLEMERTPST